MKYFLNLVAILVVITTINIVFAQSAFVQTGNSLNKTAIVQTSSAINKTVSDTNDDIASVKQAFDNNWNDYNSAYSLFRYYLAQGKYSPVNYKNAALVLINMNSVLRDGAQVLPPEQLQYYQTLKRTLENKTSQKNYQGANYMALLSGLEELLGDHGKALQYSSMAAKYNPKLYLPLEAYFEQLSGNTEKADSLYKQMPNVKSLDAESLLSKAANDVEMGKKDEALKICRDLINANQRVNDAISLAYYCFLHNNASNAEIIAFLEPNNINTPYEKIYTKYARELLVNSSHKRHAELMMQEAIKINPNDINIYLTMADAYNQIGDKQKAAELMRQASSIRNSNY